MGLFEGEVVIFLRILFGLFFRMFFLFEGLDMALGQENPSEPQILGMFKNKQIFFLFGGLYIF